jgi:GPH family glycoside/pentoside/hexuronide:cation symporter
MDTHAVAAPRSPTVPLATKLAYGFGSIAYGIKDSGFSTLLLLFYNQVIGLPANLVGLAIMIALVLDAVVDPLIGRISDHTQSRWGRRHPFMYAASLPVGLLYLLLWNPPSGVSHGVTLIYLIVVAILVRSAISCYEIPSSALAPELTTDYHERTSVLGYRYLFGWIGGMGMLLLAFTVFLRPSAAFPVGQLNPAGYRHYAIVAAILMTSSILLSALGTHREIGRLPKPSFIRTSLAGDFKGILGTLRNRAFLILLISGVFSFTNQGLNFALSTYFNTFLWGLPAAALAIFATCIIVGVMLAFGLASRASARSGKRRAAVLFLLIYLVFAQAPLLLRLVGWFPVNGSPFLLPVLLADTTLTTALGVAVAILGASMMADVVEDAQSRDGQRSEGLFFAGSFFMQKCVSGFGLLLSGAILSWVRFPAAAVPGHVPQAVLDHLILMYCAFSLASGIVAAAVLSRFPLSEADHDRQVAILRKEGVLF